MRPILLLSRFRRGWVLAAAALGAASTATAATSYKQPSFHETVVFSGLTNPTAVRFLPDGSVLVIEKSGLVKKFDSLTSTTPSVVADLRVRVHNFWDRGLLGLAVDPNFTTNQYIYVLYSNDAVIGGIAPKWGPGDGTSDPCPTPPGATTDGCVISGHLSRLTAVGSDWTASEQVLIEDWCQQFPSHSMDALAFGADGKLYITAGEGANFNNNDWGQFGGTLGSPPPTPKNPCGDPPVPVGGSQTPPTAEGGSLRSQSPRRTAGEPRVLNGSVLRVDPATGAAAAGNPLIGSSDANERRIIGYGFRNPFRMIVKPGTNDVWVADVGSGTWEEIDRIPDLTSARNYGWPCFEGPSTYFTGFNICPPQAQTIAPFYTYAHSESVVAGDGCPTGSSAVGGMAFYGGASNYPASYNNALFFSDYTRKCMWVMFPGGNGDPDPTTRIAFASSAQNPVDLQIGPDGNLYYVDFDGGNIWRVDYGPAAVASASPTYGALPLTVNFSSAGSAPGQTGDTITFAWDLDGDGQYDDSTAANPTSTYTTAGNVTVRLKVTDNHGVFNLSSPIVISPGNTPPTATILTPASTLTWKVGDTISFSGSATDAEQGTLPASALSWQVIIHHCPSNCHTHIYQTFSGVAGGSFPAPDHEYPSYLEIKLTATDSGGLTGTASVNINPQTVGLTLQSVPTGLQLTAGTTTAAAPFVKTVIVGSLNSLTAPSPQGYYQYSSWSDGGAQSHSVTATSTPATYTATYTSIAVPPPWVDQDIGSPALAGGATYFTGVFTVNGSGVDIWNTSDQFHYVYQPLSGDVTVIARVASIQNTDPWAKGGVMIRETLAANSTHAMMAITPGNGLSFQRRLATGGLSTSTQGALVAAPYWVKLVRSGNTLSGYASSDGVSWTLVGSDTVTMAASVYVGLPLTSHNPSSLCTATFDNVSVTGSANNLPSVSITSPANGATFTAPASITINATASDSDGSVTKVDFYQNGNLLGTDTTSPYSFSWSSVAAGSYSLTAVATDNLGATGTSAPVSVTVNPVSGLPPPWVDQDIGSPTLAGSASYATGVFTVKGAGVDIESTSDQFHYVYQSLSGDVTVIARVASIQNTDPWAKGGVMIRETLAANSKHAMMVLTPGNGLAFQRRLTTGGSTVHTPGALVAAPYWVKLVRTGNTLTGYSSPDGVTWTLVGSDTITMAASVYVGLPLTSHNSAALCTATFDNVSVTGSANNPPTASITSPINGATFTAPASITINATASDSDGTVSKVDFYQNGNFLGTDATSPYSFTSSSVAAGSYTLTAVATDNLGATGTSAPVNVTVNNPPTASITSPINGATFTAPASITINVTASDSDGTVSKVDFYQNGNLLGTDTTSPYSFTWSSVAAGSYSLTAVATDNLGATGTSAPVNVTVSNPNSPPTASITSPVNGATFTAPASITINATASDSDGTVTKVDFYQNGSFIGTDATSPYSFTWSNVAAGSYSLTAVVTDNLGATGTSAPISVTVNPAGGGLPPPWVNQDIGSPGLAGSASYSGGTFTVNGSGADIGSTSDQFQYVYQPVSGNVTIIARVASIQNTDPWAKGGVMIRETLAANSKHGMMSLTPGNGLNFFYRATTGGSTVTTPGGSATAPYWVKLVRTGNTLRGYKSANGTSWTLVKSIMFQMSTTVYVGIPVTSHNAAALCTATFDNVSVTSP